MGTIGGMGFRMMGVACPVDVGAVDFTSDLARWRSVVGACRGGHGVALVDDFTAAGIGSRWSTRW